MDYLDYEIKTNVIKYVYVNSKHKICITNW